MDEKKPLFPQMEEEIAASWKEDGIFERSIKERSARKTFVFYDGPPFATGLPHYGHLLQSALKDAVPRYWTMKGYRVPRRWGWDCHGLPIENLIEKELKLSSKKEIEAHGIGMFNAACRGSVMQYEQDWGRYVDRVGRWVDFKHSYMTMHTDYIESVWWVFSELYKKEYAYKGTRVSLYCPRCSTPLSNFEIAMGNSYVDKEDPAIYVKFAVRDQEKTFFLAWTTTPWTLPANVALAINTELTYVKVKVQETGETLIFAEARAAEVLKEWGGLDAGVTKILVLGRMKGAELIGIQYEPLYTFLSAENAYRVVAGSHVTADDGTGIVHIAPAFGEDDLRVGREEHLPILDTVDEEGKLIAACGPFGGLFIKKADPKVIEDLREQNLLFRAETLTHSVPICWRCNAVLLYKAQPAWFVNVTALKEKMLKTAQKINWHPDHFREGRFGKGLETAPDWNISRSRFWGSPIPVWECTRCDQYRVIGSIKELKAAAKPETLHPSMELHRPEIDSVLLACACGADMHRIPEVFDCWFESGSMPVASLHYPFENKKFFDAHFPADFIAEGQDQTRGWFYALHVLSTALFNKPAFSNVIVTGLVMAEDGKKMSKSLKNYPDPWHVLTTYGADALRYYFFTSPIVAAEGLNFSERDLQTIVRGFLNLWWNVTVFYKTYATSEVKLTKPRSAHVLDRWILSRLHRLIAEVTEAMGAYDVMRASRPLREFMDELSTWWLRRSRDRLKSDQIFEQEEALKTLREVLETFAKLAAPFTPFLAEKVYREVGGAKASVHLEKWPTQEKRLLDERLETDMTTVRQIASAAHEQRVQHGVAVRQTLASLNVAFLSSEDFLRWQKQTGLFELLREEVNVEQISLENRQTLTNAWDVTLDTVITPELQAKGWRREFGRQVMQLRKQAELQPKDRISVSFFLPESEVREAILSGGDTFAKEIRAEQLNLVSEWADEQPMSAEISVGGQKGKIVLKTGE